MVRSRHIFPAVLAVTLLTGSFISSAHAAPHHGAHSGCSSYEMEAGTNCMGYGRHGHWNAYGYGHGLTPEQREKYSALIDEYAPKMTPIRDQIFVKRQELAALRNAANPDIAAIRKTAEELLSLQNKMADLHEELSDKLKKEVGVPKTPVCPAGPHHGAGARQ